MSNILVTGGSGFLGKSLIRRLSGNISVIARNEGNLISLKQKYPNINIIPGDIGDKITCGLALKGIDEVYHLTAFKHVTLAETFSRECIKSNVIGTLNLLDLFKGKTFVAISTDKAAQVKGVYGASKLLMERAIQNYATLFPDIKYRVVRYGNVLYSTGSVLIKWKDNILNGKEIIVTDKKATRFFWTIGQAIDLIFECLLMAPDCKPYCPAMKSIQIGSLLEAMQLKYGKTKIKEIGLQPGENLHEKLMEDGPNSSETPFYTIKEIIQMI